MRHGVQAGVFVAQYLVGAGGVSSFVPAWAEVQGQHDRIFTMLSFWIIAAAVAVVVTVLLGRSVVRGASRPGGTASDMDVYRAQLDEVDRDVARGVVAQQDAERVRTEIARRLLSADTQAQTARGTRAGAGPIWATGLIAICIAGSVTLYFWLGAPGYGDMALADRIAFAETLRENRPNQQTALDSLPPYEMPQGLSTDYVALIEQLREAVAARPGDLQGHILLAQNESNIGNYAAAVVAQQEIVQIKGDEATSDDIARLGELLVLAAGGYVSPQAETALRAALNLDAANGRARYYLGLMLVQTGRPDQAFRLWDGLLRQGPEDAPWIGPIAAQIMAVAELAGVRYELPEIGSATTRGPSAEDIDAASTMSSQERMEMIGGMVAGLSDRLAREGGPPQDWARLITSLGVLGETTRAAAIHRNALEVFAGDAGALDMINDAGRRAGVAN